MPEAARQNAALWGVRPARAPSSPCKEPAGFASGDLDGSTPAKQVYCPCVVIRPGAERQHDSHLESPVTRPDACGKSLAVRVQCETVLALRRQQAQTFCALLLLANSLPMIVAGDEFLNTQRGNNNPSRLPFLQAHDRVSQVALVHRAAHVLA